MSERDSSCCSLRRFLGIVRNLTELARLQLQKLYPFRGGIETSLQLIKLLYCQFHFILSIVVCALLDLRLELMEQILNA